MQMQESQPRSGDTMDGDDAKPLPGDEPQAVPVADGVTARLPPTAGAAEAAAIVAAITAHLRAEEATEEEDAVPSVDRWKLAGRLGSRTRGRFTPDGDRNVWKLAGRTRRL
ncbi:hypothetical protein [Natronomonas sp. EA1]|uniref:hypothetical protein n=1 Tax=Natronomonas sp. EA1 TaxID=3421655 RepID=UPI003EB7C771